MNNLHNITATSGEVVEEVVIDTVTSMIRLLFLHSELDGGAGQSLFRRERGDG